MIISLKEIALLTESEIFGDEGLFINKPARIEEAETGDLTFLYLSQYAKYLESTKAAAIFVKPGFQKTRKDITYLEVKDPNKAFAKVLIHFFNNVSELIGIDKSAFIDATATIGNNVSIGKNVVISANCKIGDNTKIFHNTVLLENVEVGSNSLLYQNISVRENCKIGDGVIIHANSVIGSDGFGYIQNEKKEYQKIPQIGNVVIEDNVEIGSNVSIDRAALGSTLIKKGTKIDNLVQVAHNVVIGEHTAISGQTGISGSSKVGNYCVFGGQVGLAGHLEIGDGVMLAAQSGVAKSITKPGIYFGSPAKDRTEAFRTEGHLRNLENYVERIKALEKKISELEEKLNK